MQGLKHDLSKYSPIEFFESVKYYTGTESPINLCKKDKGYSNAWLHHQGRNMHHYEYWTECKENSTNEVTSLKMPFKYAVEMICDNIGASRAYNGKDFTYQKTYEFINHKYSKPTEINNETKEFILYVLKEISDNNGIDGINRRYLLSKYEEIL